MANEKLVENKPRKGAAAQRIPVSWGNFERKVNGKIEKFEAISRVQRGLFEKLGLPRSTKKETVRTAKDRRGRRILKAPGRSIGSKYVEVSFGEYTRTKRYGKDILREVWYRLRLPAAVSAASASILLRKAGKVKKMKWPNGRIYDFTSQ